MASAAIEASIEVAEVAAEAVAETVAETVAESAAESAAEGAAEAAAESAAEGAAEAAAESAAEEAAESSAESAAEAAAEQAAEEAAEEAAASSSKIIGKIVKVGTILLVGLGVGSVIDLVKSDTGAGKKNCPLDADDQKNLDLVQDALTGVSGIVYEWNKILKGLSKDTDFGSTTVTVKGKTESVTIGSIFWGMLKDAKDAFSSAQKVSNQCAENCAWKANMQVFTLGVVNAITALLAICELGNRSPGMQEHGIPASGDQGTIQGILDRDFPTWKDWIEKQAKKNLDKDKITRATQDASTAIVPLVKAPISQGIQAAVKQNIQPQVVANAKAAGKSASKRIFDDRRKNIILTSLIPFYGWVKGTKMISQASSDAKKAAKTAAQQSVQEAFDSPSIKEHLDDIKKSVSAHVLAEHKQEIDQKAQEAVDNVFKK